MGKAKNVEKVERVSMDALASMSDEELMSIHQELNAGRDLWLRTHSAARLYEDELAYVLREHQLRRTHREAHDRYTDALTRELDELMREEASLPNIDFSNIEFVRLHMEYEARSNKSRKARC